MDSGRKPKKNNIRNTEANSDVVVEWLEPRLLYSADWFTVPGAAVHAADIPEDLIVSTPRGEPFAAAAGVASQSPAVVERASEFDVSDRLIASNRNVASASDADGGQLTSTSHTVELNDGSAAMELELALARDDAAGILATPVTTDFDLQPLLRTIKAVNDPTVVVGNATVVEGTYLQVTSSQLQAVDTDSAPADLNFAISGITHGQFEHIADAGIPISTFTQQQINDSQIRFLHDGSESLAVAFNYSLVDERGIAPAVGTVTWNVDPVNDPPLAVDDVYRVDEGGTLSTAVNFRLHDTKANAGSPRSLHATDLDSDGDPDVVIAEFNSKTVAWSENDGNGNLTKHELLSEGGKPLYVDSADLDGDGDRDILATFTGQTNNAFWYENDGANNFVPRPISTTIGQMLKAADIDGDGDIDLAMAANASLQWFENDGNQVFSQHQVVSGVSEAKSIEIVDLDGDGDADFVVPLSGDDRVVWYENDGAQLFTQRMIGGQAEPETIGVADVNSDGFPDVFSVTTDSPRFMRWYINDGAQTFTTSDTAISVGSLYSNTASEVVDLDDDGDVDVLMASAYDDNIWLYENDGSGLFSSVLIDDTTDFGTTIAAADMDVDGDLDVVTIPWNGVSNVRWFESVYSVLKNDADAEGGPLDVLMTSGPVHGVATLDTSGHFTYTHDGSESPVVDSFTYQVTDAGGLQSNATVNLNVRALNDAPVLLASGDMTVQEGGLDQLIDTAHLNAIDADDSSSEITYHITSVPVNGTLKLDGAALPAGGSFTQQDVDSGRLAYDHDGTETVVDSFTFDVSDGGEDGVLPVTDQVFHIVVNPVNDAPVISNLAGDLLIYSEGNPPALIDQRSDALVSDEDTVTYDGATLQGNFVSGDNYVTAVLGVRSEGTGSGQISVDGSVLSYEGQPVGDIVSGSSLNITFNANATVESVSAALRNITFHNTESDITSEFDTQLLLLLSDADGAGASAFTFIRYNPVPEISEYSISLVEDGSSAGWVIEISDEGVAMSDTGLAGIRVSKLPDNATLYSDTTFTTPVTLDSVYPMPAFFPFGLPVTTSLFWSLVPDPDWVGSTSFDISVTDNDGGVAVRTVPVTVTHEWNDSPVRIAGEVIDIEVLEDSGSTLLWGSDLSYTPGGGADESDQVLTVLVTEVPDPAVGNIVLADNTTVVTVGSTYTLTQLNQMRFSPSLNAYGGPETFSFTVTDDGTSFGVPAPLSVEESLVINVMPVNDPPSVGSNDFPFTEGGSLLLTADALTVSDVDSGPNLSIALSSNYLSSYPDAFTADDIRADNLLLVHDGSESKPDIEITVTDESGASTTTSANVTFFPVNDAPLNRGTLPSAVNAFEDIDVSMNITTLFIDDPDAYDDQLSLRFSATAGTLGVKNSESLTVVGNDTGDVVVSGTTNAINTWAATSGALSYRGATDAHGAERISVFVTDNGNSGSGGGDDVNLGLITVNIASVNDSPDGTDKGVAIAEDTILTLQTDDFGFTDRDNNQFSGVYITGAPAGTLVLNGRLVANGDFVTASDIAGGLLTFQPLAHDTSEDRIAFQVADNGGISNAGIDRDSTPNVLRLSITPVNDAPAGADSTITISEDSAYRFAGHEFGFADSHDNHQLQSVIVETLPANGSLRIHGISVHAGQSIEANDIVSGNLIYSPPAGESGAGYDSLMFRVRDNGGTAHGGFDTDPDAKRISFDVNPVNDAPLAVTSAHAGVEDIVSVLGPESFAFLDSADHPPDALAAIIIEELPGNGQLLIQERPVQVGEVIGANQLSQGHLTYRTDANAHGNNYDSLVFNVVDSGGLAHGGSNTSSVPATLTFDIAAVNDAPAGSDSTVVIAEDFPHTFSRTEFGFSDPLDGHSLSGIVAAVLPVTGQLTLAGDEVAAGDTIAIEQIDDGALVFTPFADVTGVYSGLGFAVVDNGGSANSGIDTAPTVNYISFDLPNTNDTPLLLTGQILVDEGHESKITSTELSASDPDNEPDELEFTLDTLPAHGVVTLAGVALPVGAVFTLDDVIHGDIAYVHDGSESTEDQIGVMLSDGGLDGAEPVGGLLAVTIKEVIDPAPKLSGDTLSLSFGQSFSTFSGDLTDSGFSQLGQEPLQLMSQQGLSTQGLSGFTVTLEVAPKHGVVVLEPDGAFNYTHNGSVALLDEFAYRVTNDDGMYSIATVQIVIEPPLAPAFAESPGAVSGVHGPNTQVFGWNTAKPGAELSVSKPVVQFASSQSEGTVQQSTHHEPNGRSQAYSGVVDRAANSPGKSASNGPGAPATKHPAPGQTGGLKISADGSLDGWYSAAYGTTALSDTAREASVLSVVQHNKQVFNEVQWQDLAVGELAFGNTSELSINLSVDSSRPIELTKALQQFADDVEEWKADEDQWQGIVVTDATLVVSSTITAGVFASMFRGGSLAASLLATAPLWTGLDPIGYALKVDRQRKIDQQLTDADLRVEELFK